MASLETRRLLMDILSEELQPDGPLRLIGQWDLHADADETLAFSVLKHFKMGIEDVSEQQTG